MSLLHKTFTVLVCPNYLRGVITVLLHCARLLSINTYLVWLSGNYIFIWIQLRIQKDFDPIFLAVQSRGVLRQHYSAPGTSLQFFSQEFPNRDVSLSFYLKDTFYQFLGGWPAFWKLKFLNFIYYNNEKKSILSLN